MTSPDESRGPGAGPAATPVHPPARPEATERGAGDHAVPIGTPGGAEQLAELKRRAEQPDRPTGQDAGAAEDPTTGT
jgi:hypothetical protein